jgi:hypothetical protein
MVARTHKRQNNRRTLVRPAPKTKPWDSHNLPATAFASQHYNQRGRSQHSSIRTTSLVRQSQQDQLKVVGVPVWLGSFISEKIMLLLNAIPVVMARHHEAFMRLLIITVTGVTHIIPRKPNASKAASFATFSVL